MTRIEECERCKSKIATEPHAAPSYRLSLIRKDGSNTYETADVQLCSMCWDDLWEWALGETPDRSDVADPIPLERMAEGVDRHITELKDILTEIEEAKDER